MKHLVIFGTVFPEPNSTAAGKRMLQLIELFRQNLYKISFLSAAEKSEFSFNPAPSEIDCHHIRVNDNDFSEFLKRLNPDAVLFDRFYTEEQFGWKVSEACPNTIKILDTEDLHFLRKTRENAFKKSEKPKPGDYISDIFKREIASMLRCDLSLIISEFEQNLLIKNFRFNEDLLLYLPLFSEPKLGEKSFDERNNFMSIGNFLHEPNWQTVLQLKKIWPGIRKKLPGVEMHIFGAYVTEKARQLHNEKEKFLIKGRAENLEETFNNARVLLAPIPFGAGIKGKLLDSMAFGLPNVTTTIGAEGMYGTLPWNGFMEDDLARFSERAVQLYQDESLWNECRSNGFKIIENRFLKKDFEEVFTKKLQNLQENLQQHRTKNFLGQILQHHTLQSSKYLGKWIEEKNRLKN